jgi:hypothetical protein
MGFIEFNMKVQELQYQRKNTSKLNTLNMQAICLMRHFQEPKSSTLIQSIHADQLQFLSLENEQSSNCKYN